MRYEVGCNIQTGDIVWVVGPKPCGEWPDIKIFRTWLKGCLLPGEMVEADNGYRGERGHIRLPRDYISISDRLAKEGARARHETVNRRFKQFGVLKQIFRHDKGKHKFCFSAVVVLTQLGFECGEYGQFQVSY